MWGRVESYGLLGVRLWGAMGPQWGTVPALGGQMWGTVGICGAAQGAVGPCVTLWGTVGRYGAQWGTVPPSAVPLRLPSPRWRRAPH